MKKIFNDMLHKFVECYIDDLVVKTKKRENHLEDLCTVFNRMRKYDLNMNPLKCAFGITSGKFLDFIVRHRVIEINKSKIDATEKMPPPKNLKKLRSLQDNKNPFHNSLMDKLCEKFGFKQRNSSMYNAPANRLVEVFNKTLDNLLKKVVAKSKQDWHKRIGEALWAYRTTHRTLTEVLSYSLVYGVEVVLPLEQQIPSLRITIQEALTDDNNAKLCLTELEAFDEKRLEAQQKLECYQARLSRPFNKKVRPRSFQVGELVFAVRRPIITTDRISNKFLSKWDGPYVVTEVYTNGAYKIVDEEGIRVGPINCKFLKHYYP
ncbi:uncharacterized protein LOC114258235 [Camellia sinensis]|uniref:uncharacterized protein LOC114258235 n=1 Tax=Camellia sinensis TaxID=4442 RepID=UPI001036386F|nr:uncharacterized protein LOC114258235 [Camellia sinensis]